MSEDQKSVLAWFRKISHGNDPEVSRAAIWLLNSVVELCLISGVHPDEISRTVHRISSETDGHGQLRYVINLYGVAGIHGFDLHEELNQRMAIYWSVT
jgi:hypothetical protein